MTDSLSSNATLNALASPLWDKVDGQLTSTTMPLLNADQLTLLAYCILREQLLEGGFVQLIQNGYGDFIFHNPFARAMRQWGLNDFSKWLYKARKVYDKTRDQLIIPTVDQQEFMALYEQYPEWDLFDDEFIEIESLITNSICEAYSKISHNSESTP